MNKYKLFIHIHQLYTQNGESPNSEDFIYKTENEVIFFFLFDKVKGVGVWFNAWFSAMSVVVCTTSVLLALTIHLPSACH